MAKKPTSQQIDDADDFPAAVEQFLALSAAIVAHLSRGNPADATTLFSLGVAAHQVSGAVWGANLQEQATEKT